MNIKYRLLPGALLQMMLVILSALSASAQNLQVDMSLVDAVDITPDNIFNYQVISTYAGKMDVNIKGTIRYRNSDLKIAYTVKVPLVQGANDIQRLHSRPDWQFSSGALKELFLNYKFLPQGTYEYCITVYRAQSGDGFTEEGATECLYKQSKDLFLINLIEPENNAKLYEYNPLLTWMVNYPFGSSLTYRLRVAEIKKGQNTYNAITRNNPVFSEKNIQGTSLVYPVYAKPLKAHQPYAWTVDAYYKGILLGGAEPWRFTIIEDSLLSASIPVSIPYLDIGKELKGSTVFAVGVLKLEYNLTNLRSDTLRLELYQVESPDKKLKPALQKLIAKNGDNRYDIEFDTDAMKHLKIYVLELENINGKKYSVTFRYVNPDFL